MSMAARMCSASDADEAFHGDGFCPPDGETETEDEEEDAFSMHLLRDGTVFAIVMGFGTTDVDAELEEAVAAIVARTGAEEICAL
jgi:hypothetical protein